jgi:integrative and conjugative element protein (TIGR02256 family)
MFKQHGSRRNESGGVLIGQIKDNKVYILKISVPNKFDRASRHGFECNKDAAQIIMDYEFYNSGGRSIYIGEWHTHPEEIPKPSGDDKVMIKEQFRKNKLNEPFLILLIQGLTGLYIALYDGKSLHTS